MTPRAVRIMAGVRWFLLALVTALAAYSVWTFWGPKSTQQIDQEARFYCPMHPQIRAHDAGECPICHMTLEPIPREREKPEAANLQPLEATSKPEDVEPVTLSAENQRAIGLGTTLVTNATLGATLRVSAIISAPESGLSQVRVRAAGFVEKVAVRQTGVRVAGGQPLAWIYSPEIYRAEEEFLVAARWNSTPNTAAPAGANEMASAARRGLELLGMSPQEIEQLVQTGRPLRTIAVRAPSAGYVTRFNAILGSRAEPETVLYELADLSTVWVTASVQERDLVHVRVGAQVKFFPADSSSESLTARVDLIEPAVDEATRTARVRIVVPNKDNRLRPGQFGEVAFELPPALGLFVPVDAVIRTGEHEYVYVATAADRFEPREVRLGRTLAERVQVLDGVRAGESVVTRGSFMLDSESRLKASLSQRK